MAGERAQEIARLEEICGGVIEELAALGGEQKLFGHLQDAVGKAARSGEREDLAQILSDLRDWSRVLSPQQRERLEEKVRQRFGIALAGDGA